ncbi:MAG: hypothetical protein IPJ65_37945 [Archangiaceae bacterium]|nr:hypothetical protein [Archangiaceae bacterium]
MSWNWSKLGQEVEAARRACVARGKPGHEEAARRFHLACAAVWPPEFFESLEACRRGEARALNLILDFVEASPRFFRSGYTLDRALRFVARPPRTAVQTYRLQQIVLRAVGRELRVPFRNISKVARAVDAPSLRAHLTALVSSDDPVTVRRAQSLLQALLGASDERRLEDRIRSMVVTAQNKRSPALLRRALALASHSLSTEARRLLTVAFEFAMNWDLIPKEELLELARLNWPEMAPVWDFALPRTDGPGERARWLQSKVRAG